MAYSMLIDLKRCVGCHACSNSCKLANGTPPGVLRCRVDRTTEGTYPNAVRRITPVACQHCDNPKCVEVCPTGASCKREEDGIVVINKEDCIGCKSCMEACPYGVRYLIDLSAGYFGEALTAYEQVAYADKVDKTVDKCDFCLGRTADGETPQPACVAACVADARMFGTVEEIEALVAESGRTAVKLLEEEGTLPVVVYLEDVRY